MRRRAARFPRVPPPMHPVRRHLFAAVRKAGVAALALALAGCSLLPRKNSAPEPAPVWGPPASPEVGRIIDYDPAARTAWFEIPAHQPIPAGLSGLTLVVRNPDTLEPTARLVVSPHRAGRIFGAYVVEGRPMLEDEVALPASTFP